MARRNYNAWIKAARAASAKTGGLSLPAARKAYKIASERLGRPLRGVDVRIHPRIFKEAIPVKSGGLRAKSGSAGARAKARVENTLRKAALRKVKRQPKKPEPVSSRVALRRMRSIQTIEDFFSLSDDRVRQGLGELEYASTAEY